MKVVEKIKHYAWITGPDGERLATFFRFQNKPNSDFSNIYKPFDSLLNHHSRLVRNTKRWLEGVLTEEQIVDTQNILASHDVMELRDGDVSRLNTDETAEEFAVGLGELLLGEDIKPYTDFLRGQLFLEKGVSELPDSPLSLVARMMDTADGNFFAFCLLAEYAEKVGGEVLDDRLQVLLDKSYAYVNKMRIKYKERLKLVRGSYDLDLDLVLKRIQGKEEEVLNNLSTRISKAGYGVTKVVNLYQDQI